MIARVASRPRPNSRLHPSEPVAASYSATSWVDEGIIITMGTKMKVLLSQDVEKLGKSGDVKEASGGYGRNFLLPKGLAVLATKGQVKQAEERHAAQEKRLQAARKD